MDTLRASRMVVVASLLVCSVWTGCGGKRHDGGGNGLNGGGLDAGQADAAGSDLFRQGLYRVVGGQDTRVTHAEEQGYEEAVRCAEVGSGVQPGPFDPASSGLFRPGLRRLG